MCYCTQARIGELIYILFSSSFGFCDDLAILTFEDRVLSIVHHHAQNHALRFVWYHEYKRIVTNDGANKLTLAQSFIGGMTAGIFSTLGNQPFDVLKTRLQGIHAKEQYSSTWDCICKTYMTEGVSGFYKGIIPRLTRVIPGQGIIFMFFESVVSILIALFVS